MVNKKETGETDMKELPNTLSRNILRFKGLTLRIYIKLKKDDGKTFHNEFKFANKSYLRLDPVVYLILELDKVNDEYDPGRAVIIGQGNIHLYVKKMKELVKDIYNEKIFATKNNEIVLYSDMSKQFSKMIQVPGTNQGLVMVPAIVYDENEVSYEGVNLYFNSTENVIGLSIDEFEALVYTIEHTDIFMYSQLLLNYISNCETNSQPQKIQSRLQRTSIDWTNNNSVSANFRKPDNDVMSSLSNINQN